MSERMIELQRARLLNVGKGAKLSSTTPNGSSVVGASSAPAAGIAAQPTLSSPTARVESEDKLLQKFLHRLQDRDDTCSDALSGPTVPTSLSRRILQRQGVGYLDPTVAAVVSAAADRFLATVLQQSMVCRDQRLKGTELAKEAAKQRKRHLEHFKADRDDRERRKEKKEQERERKNLAAIEAAETLTKEKAAAEAAGAGKDDVEASKAKKRKAPAPGINGNKRKRDDEELGDDDDDSYDSIDEEEEYYQSYLGSDVDDSYEDDADDDDMLILRDLVHPLAAWDFHVTGKELFVTAQGEETDQDVNASTELLPDTAPEEAKNEGSPNGDTVDSSSPEKTKTTVSQPTSPMPLAQASAKPAA